MKKTLLSWLVASCTLVGSAFAQSTPPNIVVIMADDLGYGDVSFNGCPDYQTPNIDGFANQGIACTNGYATHPLCSPSRAALLTGRYQQRFGHEEQPSGDNDNPRRGLPETEITLAQLLKPAGYVSSLVGKWHLGYPPNLQPLQRGFDECFCFLGDQSGYYNATILQNGSTIRESSYLTDAFTREAVSFINRHPTQPFFLYLAYNAPHLPYDEPPANYLDRVAGIPDYNRRKYAAMILALDDGVGQVLATLEANNLRDNTLVFLLSDNGAPYASFTRNLPLRGYKANVLEGGIHVPFAFQWPARLPTPLVYQDSVSSLDIVATAAAAAGVSLPTDRAFDGVDLLPYFTGQKTNPNRTLFWRWAGLGPDGPPGSTDTIWAVRSGSLKLVTELNTTDLPPALYNLANDIGETQDVATAQPEDVANLQELYSQWNTQTISPLWKRNVDQDLEPLVLAGDWNGFNKADTHAPWNLTRISSPALPPAGTPDASNWFTNTIHVARTGGDTTPGVHSFAVIAGQKYTNQWGGAAMNIDTTTLVPYFTGTALGPTNSITFDADFYYSFRLLEWSGQTGAAMNLGVFKTSAAPISCSLNGRTPDAPTADDPVVVSISTNQPKSPEERIYLRWSTDFFLTSQLVKANGAGTNYSATIAPQPANSAVQYCVLTSTTDLAPFTTSGIIDALTLAVSDDAKYVVSNGQPAITQQPVDATVNQGEKARFDVAATGSVPLTYQWQKNGFDIRGATSSTYITPAVRSGDNGALFHVTVSNSAGNVTSNDAKLTVNGATPPSITKQPADKTVTAGQPAKFSVTATGKAPLAYQWQKNNLDIVGANKSSYTTPPATSTDDGAHFHVIVSNGDGTVTSSDATLTVNSVDPPAITKQPANKTVIVGQTANFTVAATGAPPLTCQWRKNAFNITGATKSSYTTPPATTADNGALFSVVVSDGGGSVTSNDAKLTVQ
ncbi:MAG: sulfatase-like hydrolase/transferase [Spartobacteria bacterium]